MRHKFADDTRAKILDFIETYIDEHGYPPSMRDISVGCDISSISVVSYHLRIMREDNEILYDDGVARSIRPAGMRITFQK